MPLKHAILGVLNYKEMTGYDLDRAFKSPVAFFWHAQTSQIYKELNILTKNNWVTSEIIYQSDKPNKKIFSITEEGQVELRRWLGDANIEDIMKYKNPLLIKVFFTSNVDLDQTMRLLTQYVSECERILEEMNEGINMMPKMEESINRSNEAVYWGMTMTYGFMYYQNEIKWATWCIEKLKERI